MDVGEKIPTYMAIDELYRRVRDLEAQVKGLHAELGIVKTSLPVGVAMPENQYAPPPASPYPTR